MASDFKPGARVRHKIDGGVGTLLDWDDEKRFGTVHWDDGHPDIPADTSVLELMSTPENAGQISGEAIGRASKVLESDAELAEDLREIADIWVAESGGSESPDIDRTSAQILYDAADRLARAARMEARVRAEISSSAIAGMIHAEVLRRILTEAGEA